MDFQKPLAKYLKPLNKDSLNQLEKLFNHNLKTISYFQRDLTKFKILLAVMKNFNEDKLQTIEELIEDIPKSISSRAHKLNSITEATNLNYLIKETSNSDQRKKHLKPSKLLVDEFKKFLEEVISKIN
jgi:uncharacterized protein YtpQ (UPF0354 family)